MDDHEADYPRELLIRWKADHEAQLDRLMTKRVPSIGYSELHQVIQYLVDGVDVNQTSAIQAVLPAEKIAHNLLSAKVAGRIKLGLARADEVHNYLDGIVRFHPYLPERLRTRLQDEYIRIHSEGLRGDDLFDGVLGFAQQRCATDDERAAALVTVAYYFHLCDIFEVPPG